MKKFQSSENQIIAFRICFFYKISFDESNRCCEKYCRCNCHNNEAFYLFMERPIGRNQRLSSIHMDSGILLTSKVINIIDGFLCDFFSNVNQRRWPHGWAEFIEESYCSSRIFSIFTDVYVWMMFDYPNILRKAAKIQGTQDVDEDKI